MSVLELCDSEVAAVSVEASVADAIRLMLEQHVGAVGVIDSERRVLESSPSAMSCVSWPSAGAIPQSCPSVN